VLKPLFKGLKLAPFIECANCHVLSEYGTDQCKSCGAKIKTDADPRIFILALNLGARYTPFVECPNCEKLVRVGVNRCPDCYENIPEAYALNSAAAVVANTVACDVANSIKAFDSFAVLAGIGSAVIYLLDLYVSGSPKLFYFCLLWSAMPLTSVLLWLYRFGNFKLGDDEYLCAKRDLRRSLRLWLAIITVQIIALAVRWL